MSKNLNKFGITEATMLAMAAENGVEYRFGDDAMRCMLEYSQSLLALAASGGNAAPELPEPTIDGTVYHEQLKICYTAPVHYTADQMREYGQACAAASAPNAALVAALQSIATACNCCGDRADLAEIAADALSAAGQEVGHG